MSDKKREEMKGNLKNFDRSGYEKGLLDSLKKAQNSIRGNRNPNRGGDRGGR